MDVTKNKALQDIIEAAEQQLKSRHSQDDARAAISLVKWLAQVLQAPGETVNPEAFK